MKIIIFEANAEDLKANRTILNGIVDAVNTFTQNLLGIDVLPIQEDTEDEEPEEEEAIEDDEVIQPPTFGPGED